MKKCSKCKLAQPNSQYISNPRAKDKLSYRCKSCYNLDSKNYREKIGKEGRLAYYKMYEKSRPTRSPLSKFRANMRSMTSTYRISEAEYFKLLSDQELKCYICEIEQPLCIDHNHTTGKVRKLLCNSCNIFVGFIEKRLSLIEKYKLYVKGEY